MNIEYLSKIELGTTEKPGYILKSPDLIGDYRDQNGRTYEMKTVPYLLFPEQIDGYGYKNFLEDFEKFLQKINHLSSEYIILSLLLYFLMLRDKPGYTAEKAWRKFTLEFFCSGKLHMEFPMRLVYKLNDTLHLKDYDVGKFDFESLKNKIKQHAPQSDYWEVFLSENGLSEDNVKNYFSIRRIEDSIRVFDVTSFFRNFLSYKDYIENCNDLYFQALSHQYFEKFWSEFEEQLYISLAYGGLYYNKDHFLKYGVGNGTQISVFTHIGPKKSSIKNGWVIPLKPYLKEFNFNIKDTIPKLNEKLSYYYEVTEEQDSEFYHLIELLIKFMANGSKLFYEDKDGEAYLNFWIGLDAILNDDNNEAQSNLLKNRIAALTCKHYNKMHKTQYFKIKELYDIRSAHVHAGKGVEKNIVTEIHEICEVILNVLLNMHINNLKYEDFTLENWYKDIDSLIRKGHARELIDDELLEDTGIIEIKEEN